MSEETKGAGAPNAGHAAHTQSGQASAVAGTTGGLVSVPFIDTRLTGIATYVRKRWTAFAVAIFITIGTLVTLMAATVSDLNWDILAYTGIVYEDEVTDPVELHKLAYDMVRPHADERQWHHLIKGFWYFEKMHENPEGFVSQFGMYRVKALYIEILKVMSKFMDTVTASQVINTIAIAVLAIAVFFYFRSQGALDSLPIMAVAMLLSGYVTAAVSPLPDATASALGLCGLLLFASGRPWWAVPLLILAACTRTDNIIVMFAVLLASFVYGYARIAAVVTFAAGFAAVLYMTADAQHPGWWAHFYFSVIQQQEYMDTFNPPFDLYLYVKSLVEHAALAFYGNTWAGVALMSLCAWAVMAARSQQIPTRAKTILLAALLALVGKFVVFPLSLDRIYFAQTIAAVSILVAAARPTIALPRSAGTAEANGSHA